MSKRNKLQKFAELLTFPNYFENINYKAPQLVGQFGAKQNLKGKWKELHFKNDFPITLELACGRGEYSLQLARQYPNRNFIGIDVKGARIWKGASMALEEQLDNVAFLRVRIEQLEHFFEKGEVEEIWITFPDPFLNNTKINRRLTAPPFLDRYRKILKKEGFVHLKTDDPTLYDYTLRVLKKDEQVRVDYQDDDIYAHPLPMPELNFKTYYENMHLKAEKTIKYVRFTI